MYFMAFTAFIIPSFLLFFGIEYWVARRKKMDSRITFENSVSNISIGIAERLLNLLVTGSFYALYYYVYENFAIWEIPSHWTTWILLLLATDFVWYWYHRFGHEINLMWGAHVVHHQSEEFNYSVSARITTLQAIIRSLFWCLLPLAGFQPAMVIAILVIHGAYSFFTHTEIIGKLGFLERILITPSHHRVHHASNEKYLNKNYGDIFIFWDKLFGTFQAEDEKPVYGLTQPLKSHSFLWQHFHYYAELLEACRRSKSISDSMKILLGRPEDLDPTIRENLEKKLLSNQGRPLATLRFRLYLLAQIAFSLIMLFNLTYFLNLFDSVEKALIIFIILITVINCGALLEQQRWIYLLEVMRAFLFTGWISYIKGSVELFVLSSILVLFVCTLESVQKTYFQLLYK
jgi:alkylglycerol monooxygenase